MLLPRLKRYLHSRADGSRLIGCILALACTSLISAAQTVNTWRSDAANGYWTDPNNWIDGAPLGFETIVFDTNAKLLSTNNLTGNATNRHRIVFGVGSGARTIFGTTANAMREVSGMLPVVESTSSDKQVLNFPIALLSDAVITNVTGSSLVFSNIVDLKSRRLVANVGGDVTLAGQTRSAGGTLEKRGNGVLTLSGAANNIGLGAAVEEGTLVLAKASETPAQALNGAVSVAKSATLRLAGTGANQFPTGYPISLASDGCLDLAGQSESVDVVEGSGIVTNSGIAQSVLTVGGGNSNFTFAGSIVDGAAGGKMALTKTGSGIVRLDGTNSYSGPTTISGGTLNVNSAGAGRGNYSIGTAYTLGINWVSGTAMTVQNISASLNANLQFNLGGFALPTEPIVNAGSVTAPSTGRIMIGGGIIETGKFPIVRYASYDGNFSLQSGSLPPGITAFLSNDIPNKTLLLNLTKITPAFWSGAANAIWNTLYGNWRTADQTYTQNTNGGYAVVFDDTLTNPGNTNIQITITVSPIRMDVNCTNKNYSFAGAGRISGSPRLTKNGPGKLRIATSNDFAGDTFVNGGILEIGHPSALGATERNTTVATGATLQLSNVFVFPEPLTLSGDGFLSGGALRHTAGTSVWSGPITLAGATARITADSGSLRIAAPLVGVDTSLALSGVGDIIISNTISAGGLTKEGTGMARLLGSNIFSDSVAVTAGTLHLAGTNWGPATLSLGINGTLAGNGAHSSAVIVDGTLSPGASVGLLSTGPQRWNSGGRYTVEVSDMGGAPGIASDLLNINGGIDLSATAGQFTIELVSLANGAPGPAAGFNNNDTFQIPIASLAGAVTNFDAAAFTIDTSRFSNDLAGGRFVIETNASLYLRFSNNHAPTAANAAFTRAAGTAMKIAINELLGSFTTDADDDGREIIALGSTLNGGTVERDGDWIFYTPPPGDGDDSFAYTVCDVRSYRPGDTVRTATANIAITKIRAAGRAQHIDATGGSVSITFAGIPGFVYDIERSTDLNMWTVVTTVTNPESGVFPFVDPDPPAEAAYYRLRQH